jgi:CubicO group peptidase (beta-lactamase class C family)
MRSPIGAVAGFALLWVATCGWAHTNATVPELTSADLEAYLDGLVPDPLARDNIAGAAISVVKDGKVLFAKGYGFADVEKRKPVTSDATPFRSGSISKLFTWTSVMQLRLFLRSRPYGS